ncbi:hypothetical protein GBA52_000998 [Prunus armeniaca]|nr:hypothetical protein GBA52_000998 [Prunus armeniaca]
MATASSSSSRARTRSSGPVLRSLSPSGRFYTASNASISSSASGFASSTSSSFSSPTSAFFSHHKDHHYYNQQINHHHHHRSSSPTRVNLYTSSAPSPSVRFSIDHRSISPNHSNRSITVSKKNGPISMPKKTCMCSPTSHPGSFRCSLHKNVGGGHNAAPYPTNRLNMRRSAMTNSLVRIGGVEGEWVKRALTALIRPCAHQQRRRAGFQPRPSRLSAMSTTDDKSCKDLVQFGFVTQPFIPFVCAAFGVIRYVCRFRHRTFRSVLLWVPLAVVIIVTVFRYVCSVQSAVVLYKVALLFLRGVKLLTNFHGLLKALKFENMALNSIVEAKDEMDK